MRVACIAVICALTVSGCTSPGSADETHAPPLDAIISLPGPPPGPAPSSQRRIPILLNTGSGGSFSITLISVKERVQATGERREVAKGTRLFAAQFEVDNTGSLPLSEGPLMSVHVTDDLGHMFAATQIDRISAGRQLPGTVDSAPGSSILGWLPFQVPNDAQIVTITWEAGGGLGSTAAWNI